MKIYITNAFSFNCNMLNENDSRGHPMEVIKMCSFNGLEKMMAALTSVHNEVVGAIGHKDIANVVANQIGCMEAIELHSRVYVTLECGDTVFWS